MRVIGLIGGFCLWSWAAGAMAVSWSALGEGLRAALVAEASGAEILAPFYEQRSPVPLWFPDGSPSARGAALLTTLQHAEAEGLNPADYDVDRLQLSCFSEPPRDPVACEWWFSDALLRYARDVGYGLSNPAEMDPNWHLPAVGLPAMDLLQEIATSDSVAAVLAKLPPSHVAYQRLRSALASYRGLAARGGWSEVPDGPLLRPGAQAAQVLALRQRLGVDQPELNPAVDSSHYDPQLVAAVERFQARHGLKVDGIVGPDTLAALNVPVEERVAQIRLNMERWRWLPRELGERHVLVNLPAFELTATVPDAPPLRMRVISGRPDRTSPAFQSRITRLVFNPDWTVPYRLAVLDKLPELQKDPLALQAKRIHIYRREGKELIEVDPREVDWRRYSRRHFPFLLRQEPGVENALGQLKFDMPNPFDIYLHDTPAKGLFEQTVRTLSSGCIRVEHPIRLASRLLGHDQEASATWIRKQIAAGQPSSLPLAQPVPVYLVYLTAWVDDAGNLQFRNDVYGRDLQMRDRFTFP